MTVQDSHELGGLAPIIGLGALRLRFFEVDDCQDLYKHAGWGRNPSPTIVLDLPAFLFVSALFDFRASA